jgi:hypothetical protein
MAKPEEERWRRFHSGDDDTTYVIKRGPGVDESHLTVTEERWLEYARRVVNVSEAHISGCESAGGAPAGVDRDPATAVRWPGYIGKEYVEGHGVLCVAQVHREGHAKAEKLDDQISLKLVDVVSRWKQGQVDDVTFLLEARSAYRYWIPLWTRWKQHFKYLVEDLLGLTVDEIAYANLAKCMVPIETSPDEVVRFCQGDFPVCDLVEAVKPRAVLCCRVDAYEGGPTIKTWCTDEVYTWDGRHGTNRAGDKLNVWGPRMAEAIRGRSRFG